MNFFLRLWRDAPAASVQTIRQWFPAAIASFVAIAVTAGISSWIIPQASVAPHMLLVASMGASVMLVIAIPNSPLTQPYALVMGHIMPATIGVLCAMLPLSMALQAATCIGLSLGMMYVLRCLHPPGGAASLVPIIMGADAVGRFDYVFIPVLLNVLSLLAIGVLIHRFWLKKEYPVKPPVKTDPIHKHNDPSPLQRLGISAEDLKKALGDYNAYLNITSKDLSTVFSYAQQHAYNRKFSEVRCLDIMSRDVRTVTPETRLDDAWATLRLHKVKILPVINESHHIVGVISLVDFLKRANLKTYEDFSERLSEFINPQRTMDKTKPRRVEEIMVRDVFSVSENESIAFLVPLLSDKGVHHVPVVDAEQKLCGIITQSDLIAALYTSSINSQTPRNE